MLRSKIKEGTRSAEECSLEREIFTEGLSGDSSVREEGLHVEAP